MFNGEKIIDHGVYFFFSPENDCLYVGKNSSQSFVERIPWHFALSEESWMNHFVKYHRKFGEFKSIPEAAIDSKRCQLLLMPVANENLESIKPLEKFFRLFLKPRYNSYSLNYQNRYRSVNMNEPLYKVIGKLSRPSR